MIYGVGTDIVQIDRIQAALKRENSRFLSKILGPLELVEYEKRNHRNAERGALYLATRFAAKEALSKAIGTGMRFPMTWHAAQLLNHQDGRPEFALNDELGDWMKTRNLCAFVSISDERDVVCAFVIVEKSE
ncbi:MAG: holo-ACP synthase [Burkholderiaceae bacterium]|nr:holo-ACP synthase [Burkholderiaceae bacterium]